MPDWTDVQPDEHGARSFSSQMVLDKALTGLLTKFLEQGLGATVTPANKPEQLRGIDLWVQSPTSDSPVGVDLKADQYTSRNISLEVLSQDRPNTKHPEPVVGWMGKESPLVAYLFGRTGELVVLNMTHAYPWFLRAIEGILDGRRQGFPYAWVTATPNSSYQSYNFVLPITGLLKQCPGTLYLRMTDLLALEDCEELTGTPFKPLMVPNRPTPANDALALLATWCETLPKFDPKEQLSRADKERLLRWMEPRVRFKNVDAVQALGRRLQESRPRLRLAEDLFAIANPT